MRRGSWRPALALISLLSACAPENDTITTTSPTGLTTTSGQLTTTTTTSAPQKQQVGEIIMLESSEATLDDQPPAAGDPIVTGAALKTFTSGIVRFGLNKVLEDCTLDPEGSVRAAPEAGVLLRVEMGTTLYCRTGNSPTSAQIEVGDFTVDPSGSAVFSLMAGGAEVSVGVCRGVVDVRGPRGGVISVPPLSQQIVTRSATPPASTRFRPSDRQATALRRLVSSLPATAFTPPAAVTGGLRVGVVQGASEDTKDFVSDLLAGFGGSSGDGSVQGAGGCGRRRGPPQVPVSLVPLATGTSAPLGPAPGVDLVVSFTTVPGADGLPLFIDDEGRNWSVFFEQSDTRFAQPLRRFLGETLADGTYAQAYLTAFSLSDSRRLPYGPVVKLAPR